MTPFAPLAYPLLFRFSPVPRAAVLGGGGGGGGVYAHYAICMQRNLQ